MEKKDIESIEKCKCPICGKNMQKGNDLKFTCRNTECENYQKMFYKKHGGWIKTELMEIITDSEFKPFITLEQLRKKTNEIIQEGAEINAMEDGNEKTELRYVNLHNLKELKKEVHAYEKNLEDKCKRLTK